MYKVNDMLKWSLSQTTKFNKRNFYDSPSLQCYFNNLLLFRQSTKLEKCENLFQLLETSSDYDQHRLIECWKLLLSSERLYDGALKVEAIKRTFTLSEEQWHHETYETESKVSKTPKKFKINLRFFRILKGNFLSKKEIKFEDKVEIVAKNLEMNLLGYFKSFLTHCKRYGLVSSEEQQLNLQQLFSANKKFHNNLWILHKKIYIVYESLQAEITKLEFQAEEESKIGDLTEIQSIEAKICKILDEWGVYQLIVLQFISFLKDICTELEKNVHVKAPSKNSKSSSRTSIEFQQGMSTNTVCNDTFATYIRHESNVNKLLVENISNVIIQLRIESPTPNRYEAIVAELIDCLNLFRSRQRPRLRPTMDDDEGKNFILFLNDEQNNDADIKAHKERRDRINENESVLECWSRRHYSLEIIAEAGETLFGNLKYYCIGKRRSSL